MEELPPEQAVPNAPFPAPPPFWKHFSSANLSRLSALRPASSSSSTSNPPAPVDLTALPLELRYLLPPPVPPPGASTYPTFHEQQIVDPSSSLSATAHLSAADLSALLIPPTPTTHIPAALKSLTRSLLPTLLQLTDLLATDPMHESRYELLEHIKNVFVNIHVLVNSYRPHQAREGVVNMLTDRIEDARAEIKRSDALRERVEGFLKGLQDSQEQVTERRDGMEADGIAARQQEGERTKLLWKMIHEMEKEDNGEDVG